MNNCKFYCFLEKHVGFGVRWEDWNGGVMLSLSIPFLTTTILLGCPGE